MAGFGAGQHPLYRVKLAAILVYLISTAALLAMPRTRRDPGIRPLLWLWGIYAFTMAFYENTKVVMYGFSLIPFYVALTAIAVHEWWRASGVARAAAMAASTAVVVVGTAGLLYTSVVKNDYNRVFLPTAKLIEDHTRPGDTVFASSELGFAIPNDRKIVDDANLGYYSHKAAEVIVLHPTHAQHLEKQRHSNARLFEYVRNMLDHDYTKIYSNSAYTVYRRRAPAVSGNSSTTETNHARFDVEPRDIRNRGLGRAITAITLHRG
jgi:hypothetical protein